MPAASSPQPQVLRSATLWIIAAACGASAANIFYNQPLLGKFARAFQSSPSQAGLVATAAQVGYGLGLFFFVPLGDLLERRRVVLWLMALCTVLLGLAAVAPSLTVLIWLHLFIGMTTMNAQILIPFGSELAPPSQRGRIVGILMAGLLCGVLSARMISGYVGQQFGWRTVYALAAVLMVFVWLMLWRGLPRLPLPVSPVPGYGRFMAEMVRFWGRQRNMWTASVSSGLSFGCYTAFWTILVFLLMDRYGLGAVEAGLFGLLGLSGILAAPLAGKVTDRRGPSFTITTSLLAIIAGFALMGAVPLLAALITGAVLVDIGVQSIQVAAQTRVISLVPDAGSRLNTGYMVVRFAGGALGSFLGATVWPIWHWSGVCLLAICLAGVALVLHLAVARR